jgi:acetate kinase
VSVLVLNAGSSTIKYSLFAGETLELIAGETLEAPPANAVEQILASISGRIAADPVAAVGHRVVHGGRHFRESVRVDDRVLGLIGSLAKLAPLHNPPALRAIVAARRALPGIPHVAVFDTAFFAEMPPECHVYALPYEWYEKPGIRRYGFHGISHAYCSRRAAELLGRDDRDFRAVVCHLGNGCSATAVRGGKPVATTMGFTPLEGLMMGTRAGSIDPGILFYAMERMGIARTELYEVLQRKSGLLGVSGVSSDFREVTAAANAGNGRARLALAIYAHSVRSAVGALAVTIGGVDALVFTAGVGENSAELREEVCRGLGCLSLTLDPGRNRSSRPDADIAAEGPGGRILAVHTREDLHIAREALQA